MSHANIPKSCELCSHPLVFFAHYGKSFCPVCEKEQLDRFSEWVEEQKESSSSPENEGDATQES